MNTFNDPKFRRLLDWAEARREHVTDTPIPFADDESADAVMWIESFLDAAAVLARIEPPASLRSRLRASFANHQRQGDERSPAIEMLGPDTTVSFQLPFGGRWARDTGRRTNALQFALLDHARRARAVQSRFGTGRCRDHRVDDGVSVAGRESVRQGST